MRHLLSCHPERTSLGPLHKLHRPRTPAQCNHRQPRSNDLGPRLCRLRAHSGCGRGRSANVPVETVPVGPAAERLSADHGHAPIQEPSPQRMPNIGAPAFWTAVFVTRAQPSPHSDSLSDSSKLRLQNWRGIFTSPSQFSRHSRNFRGRRYSPLPSWLTSPNSPKRGIRSSPLVMKQRQTRHYGISILE